jgi:NADH-quinone oxidoreductase subunit A
MTYTALLGYLLLFSLVGVGFILVHLLVGKLVRPAKPDAEKLTIYECGEPTIGSAWIQFDVRYYVVALLFVIFDVEVAFFFPWAVVFGKANAIAAGEGLEGNQVVFKENVRELIPPYPRNEIALEPFKSDKPLDQKIINDTKDAARQVALIAFLDIVVFFGILLVGFAYLWKRGDIDWVRSTAAEEPAAAPAEATQEEQLVAQH